MSPSSTKPGNGTDSRAGSLKRPGHLNSITESLRERAEQARRETEKLLQDELKALSESLRKSVRAELLTIMKGTEATSKHINEKLSQSVKSVESELQKLRKKRRTWPGLLLILAIICASGFTTVLLQNYLIEKDLAEKQAAIRSMDETLSKAKTWGLTLSENQNGRFIILPPGLELRTGFKAGKNEAAQIVKK